MLLRSARLVRTLAASLLFTGVAGALLAVPSSPPPSAPERRAGRYLRLGDEALQGGWPERARRFWHRASRASPATAGPVHQRLMKLARERTFPTWPRTESENFILHAAPGSAAAHHPETLLQQREAAYQEITARLGVQPAGPIHLYVYTSSRQGQKLLGRPLAFAEPALREIHVRQDQAPGHEEAHVIAWAWNGKGSGVSFLEEGLAVALSTHPGSPHVGAAEIAARGLLPSLDELIHRFPEYRYGYTLAGSFVSDLLRQHGVEVVRALYTGGPEPFAPRLEEATGMPLGLLQAAWETTIATTGSDQASREPILHALDLLRLDQVERAVALLEQRRREHPDNPVIDYALAYARREAGDRDGSIEAYRRLLATPLSYQLAWMRRRAEQALMEMHAAEPGASGAAGRR